MKQRFRGVNEKAQIVIIVSLIIASTLLGCRNSKKQTLILATTTSVNDSGLLSYLLPQFTKETGIEVKTIAVGSGEALEMGAKGDADIVLAHSPDRERELIDNGSVAKRTPFMYNYFVIAGPKDDPAKISDSKTAEEAFKKITDAKQIFISRGDESGTNKKELKIWNNSGITPQSNNYSKTGQGMAETLLVANEKKAYTLTDKATFISSKKNLANLRILLTGKESLKNTYSLIELKAGKKNINYIAAKKFKIWLLSKQMLAKISNFGIREYKEPLFFIID